MASFAAAAYAAMGKSMSWGQALSGIFGSISLTAWICLLLPQLIANYKAKNADGLSMAFLVVWLLGDVSNLVGAVFTKLAPSAIALATYFCCLDTILITQTGYYKVTAARRRAAARREALLGAQGVSQTREDAPLLGRRSSTDLPGSLIRHDTHRESALEPIRKVITGEDETQERRPWLNNVLGLAAIYVVGFSGWFLSYKAGAWDGDQGIPNNGPEVPDHSDAAELKAKLGLALGYLSALFYLCARLPQIFKNYQEKSCEGLSLLFFMLSLTGNMTYGLSLLSYSQNKEYLLTTLPWLLGSLGTMVEDSTIFVQFRIYGDGDHRFSMGE
ncbi:hypothetical protein QQS21_005618 [Conoideocrella luteorostrata]|uniref:Vacuolar membrane PQ loop repeat protein n=1 Tax=Conoideocrella luteorostrata TaxID=1105319 RepID=A0AAJ0FZ04_9HYPO|nr:hypothetical protein QQS21_005618 [Conoideocrella luteorostrata]